MTLKEKFLNVLDYTSLRWTDTDSEECEKITDEFAIGFVEWLDKLQSIDYKTYEQLLKIYKKEKEL